MVNILEELKNSNKKLLEENKQLKEKFGVNNNNNLTQAEIRQEIIEAVSSRGVRITDNPDETLLDDMMVCRTRQNWLVTCEQFPVKWGRQIYIGGVYQLTECWKKSFEYLKKIRELENKETTLTEQLQVQEKVEESLKKELEQKVAELTVFKKQVEDLEQIIEKALSGWFKEEMENKNDWVYWNTDELKGLINKVKSGLNETIIKIIQKWEQDAKSHSEAVDTAEKWKDRKVEGLNDEIKTQSLMLQESDKMLEEEIVKNTKLQEELEEAQKCLVESEKREEELNRQLYLERKPLPALPKEEENKILNKQGIFKRLKAKASAKVQQLQKLIKKENLHNQTLVAKIEVPVK